MKKKLGAGSAVSLALAASFGMSFGLVACAPADGGKVGIGMSAKSPLAQKLDTCSKEKLSNSLKTFARGTKKICRKSATGEPSDRLVLPSYQMYSKNGLTTIDQVIAYKLNIAESIKIDDETRMVIESHVTEFLNQVCAPIVRSPFKKASLGADFQFVPHRPGIDRRATATTSFMSASTPVKTPAAANTAAIEPVAAQAVKAKTAGEKLAESRRPEQRTDRPRPTAVRDLSIINSLLELDYKSDHSISIRDDLNTVSSGPLMDGALMTLSGESAAEDSLQSKAEDSLSRLDRQRLFCGQVLIRTAENLGLGGSRDCSSIEATASETAGDVKKGTDKGLFKPGGHSLQSLPTLKLEPYELVELMEPVCGAVALP